MPFTDRSAAPKVLRRALLAALTGILPSLVASGCYCEGPDLFSSTGGADGASLVRKNQRSCSAQLIVSGVRLSADSADLRLAPTTSGTVTLSLTSSDTAAHGLRVIAPADVQASLRASSLVPGRTTTLTLTADAAATTGRPVVVTVIATLRNAADTLPLAVNVVPPFTVNSVTPLSAPAGTSVGGQVFIARAANFTAPVTWAISGLPTGWLVSYPAASETALPFDIAIPALTPLGTYTAQLRVSFGATTVQQALAVTVVNAPPPPDFTIVTTPSAITLTPGQSGSYHVGLFWTQVGAGAATFSVSGLPPGVTGTFSRTAATDTTRLTVTVPANATARTDTLTIGAVAGSGPSTIAHTARVVLDIVPVASLAIAVAPPSITVQAGSGGIAGVTITRTGNVGAVTLDVPNLPNGVTAAFSAAPNTAGTITMSLGVSSSVAPGTYPLTVRGTAGSLQATAPLSLTVTAAATNDLQLQLPATITLAAGGTSFAPVQLTRSGTVRGQPVQLAVTTAPASGQAWVAPSLTRADTASLQVLGGSPGTYPVVVTATAGSLVRTATTSVIVTASSTPDFQLVPQPTALTIPIGQFTPLTLGITRVNGHADPITLSAVTDSPGAYAVNFAVSPITSQGSTAVNIYVSELVAPGPHVLRLRGTANGVQREVLVTLLVQ